MKIKHLGPVDFVLMILGLGVALYSTLYCYFKNWYEMVYFCLFWLLLILLFAVRVLIVKRTVEIDKDGCTVKNFLFKRRYKWSELKTIRMEDYSLRVRSKGDSYLKGVIFSTRENFRTPDFFGISTYLTFCWRPLRFFVVLFKNTKVLGSYGANEEEFMSKMAEYGVEIQRK